MLVRLSTRGTIQLLTQLFIVCNACRPDAINLLAQMQNFWSYLESYFSKHIEKRLNFLLILTLTR